MAQVDWFNSTFIITCRKKKRPLCLRLAAALRATRRSAQAVADDRVQDQVNGAGEDEKDEGGTLRVKDEWRAGNLQAGGCQRVLSRMSFGWASVHA